MDSFPSEKRSWIMRQVRGADTTPERKVRSILHKLGYRFRLHREDIRGKPDIVFSKRRKVIFVHGCFWHGHSCKRGNRIPKSNTEYWTKKIASNKRRDRSVRRDLKIEGWKALTIWECELKNANRLARKLVKFLENDACNK
jgi:DNA mismatch endonuclease (patch repair protein)